jgi:hypothetical protein
MFRRVVRPPAAVRSGLPVPPAAILAGFWLTTLAAGLSPAAGKLKFVWPVLALGVGWSLLRNAPRHYVSFVWLLWFFTPFVRRLVDFGNHAFDRQNPCMLAPPLVTALCFFQLARRSHVWKQSDVTPFLMILGGAAYALARGIGSNGPLSPAYDSLEWFVPPAFALYLYVFRGELFPLEKTMQLTFTIGVLAMGVYGLLQFMSISTWDAFWMNTVPMASNGVAEPFKVRVFSTMNSPGPFSLIMMAALLLVPSGKGFLRWLSLGPGLAAFLLSMVRAAWGGYAAGMIFLAVRLTGKLKGRVLTIILTLVVVLTPLLMIGPVADQISKRMESLSDVQHDDSANVRTQMYIDEAATCFLNIGGSGLGSTGTSTKLTTADGKLGEKANFDSGVMNLPYVLGWPGAVLYLGGAFSLLLRVVRDRSVAKDFFLCSSAAICIGALGQLVFINTLIGVQGMVFWTFLGVCLAGRDNGAPPANDRPGRRVVAKRTAWVLGTGAESMGTAGAGMGGIRTGGTRTGVAGSTVAVAH